MKRNFLKKGMFALALVFAAVLMPMFSSCMDTVPCDDVKVPVTITIHHELLWTDTVYYPDGYMARTGKDVPSCRVRYALRAYPKGYTYGPHHDFEFYSDDISLADFTTQIELPMGEWDIYAWQDLITYGQEPYYNITNFDAISYLKPYRADTDHRDCFRGALKVPVTPKALGAGGVDAGTLVLSRPTAKYVFIATDYQEFLKEYASRGPEDYTILALYSTFMPTEFNNFTDIVADSERGHYYSSQIISLGNGRAEIAMDYVFSNPKGGVQVQLALRSPKGELTPITEVITVPLKRSRITYIEGAFLTAKGSSGIEVDFGFEGDINIKI